MSIVKRKYPRGSEKTAAARDEIRGRSRSIGPIAGRIPAPVGFLLAGVLMMASSGCGDDPGSTLPTLIPTEYLPTAIALTIEASGLSTPNTQPTNPPTNTLEPTLDPSPTPILTPTSTPPDLPLTQTAFYPTPTITLTPTPLPNIPFGKIQIFNPGQLSKVISPLRLITYLIPGANGNVTIELIGEDERLLVRNLLTLSGNPGARVNLIVELDFEIPGVAETARLQIITRDQYSRLQAVASVGLILLSEGETELTPSGDSLEKIIIQEPLPRLLIQGGNLTVSGIFRSSSDKPLLVELTTAQGRVVGSRLASVVPVPGENYSLFAVEVPYSVTSLTWVRLSVREQGDRIPGTVHLSSLEVQISP